MTVIPTAQDYPDFTRLSQFTSAPLIAANTTATSAPKNLGIFYTGGFESLVVRTFNQQAGVGWVFSFQWFADQALTQQVGQANLRTLSATPISAQLPNRGPWCQVLVNTNSVAAHSFQLLVLPRTGTPSGAGAFLDGLIHGGSSQAVGAAGTFTQNAFGLTPGPASLSIATDAAAWTAKLFGLDELSAAVGLFGGTSASGGSVQTQRVILPPYWTQLVINNSDAGVRHFDYAVQADL